MCIEYHINDEKANIYSENMFEKLIDKRTVVLYNAIRTNNCSEQTFEHITYEIEGA